MTDHNITILPMDPKQQLNQLDPKLKEAYERVMGTPVGSNPQNPSQPTTGTPAPTPTVQIPSAAPAQPTTPMQPGQTTPSPAPTQPTPQPMPTMMHQMPYAQQAMPASPMANAPQMPMQTPTPANPFGAPMPHSMQQMQQPAGQNSGKPAPSSHGFVAGKKGFRLSPALIIVGGVIFLIAYTIFWFKFFNIPIPFISQ